MNAIAVTRGTLPEMISNPDKLYQGDLIHYFRALFNHAQNLHHPYHNFRHMTHVAWLCHAACRFYESKLSQRTMRNLLIAALFHDFDHSGMYGSDDLNIERAIRGLRKHAASEDAEHLPVIEALIRTTQYPPVVPDEELDLCGLILRDADKGQALSVAWIQQVIFGLAAEWGHEPVDVLRAQDDFLSKLVFKTDWAKKTFPQSAIEAKRKEGHGLCALLGVSPIKG